MGISTDIRVDFELDLRGPILKSGLNEGGAFDGAFFQCRTNVSETRGI